VAVDLLDAIELKMIISNGTICQFLGWDADGDALLRVGNKNTVVFVQDFIDSMTLR